MNSGRIEYTFFWFIENYNYCNEEKLVSPSFTVDKLEDTTWKLYLYPRSATDEHEGYISLYLCRSAEDDGPEKVSLNFELSLLKADGSAFSCQDAELEFERRFRRGCGKFLKMDEILLRKNSDYLPENILTVRCKMWKGEGKVQNIEQSSVRSRIRIEENYFMHVIENFSTLQPYEKKTTMILSHSPNGCFITSSLYFTEENSMMIEIILSDTNHILCKCEFSVLDQSGNVLECEKDEIQYDGTRKRFHLLPLSLTREAVLNRKSEYLPDDKLSLMCECTFSSGLEFQTTEKTLNEVPLTFMKRKRNYVHRRKDYKDAKKLCTNPCVSEDMKALYINQCLTDVEVKTETKSFSAHKSVLCARSPIFKAMLTSDMKEKNSDCIHVYDLKDDIVQQMLLFLYSDNIEDLQWENATQLYYAADKYEIGKLKEVCSSFLVRNLTTTNAGELLVLADTHSDSDLKKSVEDFILEHERQVFGSSEWEMFMETNPFLALKTMHLKYKRKN